ncbi:hypothetical protein SK128_007498 [Halocaridina rubra]|uniref:G-protein coupled receptors family 1 profile domain-containing protein n=1 Tax=Halocaridina rubra TaxID=373956 RepID=A0AAN8X9P4_HALRR
MSNIIILVVLAIANITETAESIDSGQISTASSVTDDKSRIIVTDSPSQNEAKSSTETSLIKFEKYIINKFSENATTAFSATPNSRKVRFMLEMSRMNETVQGTYTVHNDYFTENSYSSVHNTLSTYQTELGAANITDVLKTKLEVTQAFSVNKSATKDPSVVSIMATTISSDISTPLATSNGNQIESPHVIITYLPITQDGDVNGSSNSNHLNEKPISQLTSTPSQALSIHPRNGIFTAKFPELKDKSRSNTIKETAVIPVASSRRLPRHFSDDEEVDLVYVQDVQYKVYSIVMPPIICLGVIANALCIVVLVKPKMRSIHVNKFLAVWFYQHFKKVQTLRVICVRATAVVILDIIVHLFFFINAGIKCRESEVMEKCPRHMYIIEDSYRKNNTETWHTMFLVLHECLIRWIPGVLLFVFNVGLVIAITTNRLNSPASCLRKKKMNEFRVTLTSIAITGSFIVCTFPNTVFVVWFSENVENQCYGHHEVFRGVANILQLLEHVVHIVFLVMLNPSFRCELFCLLTCKSAPDIQSDDNQSSKNLQMYQIQRRSGHSPFTSKSYDACASDIKNVNNPTNQTNNAKSSHLAPPTLRY